MIYEKNYYYFKHHNCHVPFIDHVNLRIPENRVAEAIEFYEELLGFQSWKLEDFQNQDRTSFFFKISDNALLNIRPVSDFEPPAQKNYDHFCIVVDKDLEQLEAELRKNNYEIIRKSKPLGTQGRQPAIYVKDPFGYIIELKSQPLD